jgi:hypothetical protein
LTVASVEPAIQKNIDAESHKEYAASAGTRC